MFWCFESITINTYHIHIHSFNTSGMQLFSVLALDFVSPLIYCVKCRMSACVMKWMNEFSVLWYDFQSKCILIYVLGSILMAKRKLFAYLKCDLIYIIITSETVLWPRHSPCHWLRWCHVTSIITWINERNSNINYFICDNNYK